MKEDVKLFVATKAFILHKGRVLILREAGSYVDGTNQGKYDFPGGRLEPGEKFDDALKREVSEETGLEISFGKPLAVDEWRPKPRGESWQIVGIFFECFSEKETVVLSNDHDHYQWIDPQEHKEYPLMENLHSVFETYLKQ